MPQTTTRTTMPYHYTIPHFLWSFKKWHILSEEIWKIFCPCTSKSTHTSQKVNKWLITTKMLPWILSDFVWISCQTPLSTSYEGIYKKKIGVLSPFSICNLLYHFASLKKTLDAERNSTWIIFQIHVCSKLQTNLVLSTRRH